MRKLFTFLLTMVVAIAASAAIKPTIQLGADYTGADIVGKTFAIVNRTDGKALYGTNNQNLAYGAFSDAFVSSNSGYLWKIQTAEGLNEGEYLLRLIKPDGSEYSIWGSPGYLNTQPNPGVSFILGLNNQNGQDCANGAVYKIAYVEGQGYSLQNLATGQYQGYNNSSAHVEEATYWSFVETITETYVPALKELLAEGENMKKNGASSAEYDAAIAGIDPETTADALADAQKVEAALPILAKTQTKAGSDFTRAIVNPFIDGNADGWTIERPVGGNGPMLGTTAFEYWAGNASDRAAASFDYWQEVTGIPNGTYTVGAYMYNDLNNEGGDYTEFAATSGVYATVGETTVSKLVDANGANYVYYETDGIEVTDGTLRVGVKNFATPMAARWFSCDGFTLTLVEPAAAPAPEKDAWYTDNLFCYKDAANNVSRSMELPWVADPDDAANGCIALSSAANAANDHDLQFMIRGAEYDGADLMNGAFAEGIGFKVSFKVKADGNYSGCLVGSFNSITATGKDGWKFGSYLGNQSVKLDVTTEWQTVSYTVIAGSGDAGKLTAIGFNLADKGGVARTFYFDDVQITRGGSEWYLSTRLTDKWKVDGVDHNKPAEFKPEGYAEIVTTSNANTWDNQVFFQIADAAPNGKLKKNDKITLQFQAMATLDAESTLTNTEIQAGGGFHKSYDGAGWLAGTDGATIKVGDWTEITKEFTINNDAITNFSLDLSYDSKPITYRFKDVKVTFESGVEEWTQAIKYGVKVTPFTQDPADETKWIAGEDQVNDPVYKVVDGNGVFEVVVDGKKANPWDTQFFFQIADASPSKALKMNDKVTLKYRIMAVSETLDADTELSLGGNLHTACGSGWFAGAPAGKAVIGKWTDIEQLFEIGDPKTTNYSMNMTADDNPITYYIDDVSVQFEAAPILDWVELISNGNCEAAPEHVFAASKETPVDGSNTNQSRYVDSGDVTYGKVIEVAAGAKESQVWDNQFWIYEPYALPGGTSIIVEFDYKAETAAKASTQSHNAPGAYLHWAAINDVNFTTEWQHFKFEGKIPTECDDNGTARFRSIAFNMSEFADANKYYIDNVSFKVPAGTVDGLEPVYIDDYKVVEYIDPSTLEFTDNLFTNGDIEGEDMSAFIAKVNDDADGLLLTAGSKTFKGSNQILVKSVAREKDPADETKYLGNDHDTQFFVRLPYALPAGTTYFFSVDYLSNKVANIPSQTHGEPGQWKGNKGVGSIATGSDAQTLSGYFKAEADMRSIAFNLAAATEGGQFYFDNFVFKVVKDDEAAIKEFTATWDGTSTWNETFALNQAVDAGRTTEIEGKGYTDESVKALTDAIAAGKAELANAEATKETLAAAAKAITDAIEGLTTGAAEELLPKPETDPDYPQFAEIAQDQGASLDDFARTAFVEGEEYNTYTASEDLQVAFKMYDIDVEGCDYVTVKFAKPAPAGWCIAFWAQGGTDNVEIPAGATEYKYVFADDAKCAIKDGVLPQICVLTLWGAAKPLNMDVYGIYKHKVPAELAYTDLTPEMFFQWTDWTDAEPTASAYCEYKIDEASGQPYGDPSVNNYADLSEYATLEVTATAGSPRFLFNRDVAEGQWSETEADSHLIDNTKGGWSAKYFTSQDNGDGSTTYVVDIAAIVADKGFAHLMAIKGANWADVTVTEMKLGYVGEQPALPVPTNINGVEDGESVKDGKYFINGQIVIVKNGVKYNAAGVAIK